MADRVQYRLERMADELDDLEKKGLFKRWELEEIVKKRRKFEYRLKRRSPLKQDFLSYIEYETQLDTLRRLRKKLLLQGNKNNKKDKKKMMKLSVSDFSGVARILEIYRLATVRYKGDLQLWFRYLEFCREHRNGRIKKVLAQVIRFHPKVSGVWIYAAAWEFDHNLNVAAARALMQNGLRVCPTSEDLWVEYLRMELTYLNKLNARKVALGESKGTLARVPNDFEEKQWREENKDLFMSLDEGRGNIDGSNAADNEEPEEKVDLFQEQGFLVLQTVYTSAIEALPSSFGLRKRFLEILEATNLAKSEEMHKEILNDIKRNFSKEPECWDWLARRELTVSIGLQETREVVLHPEFLKAVQVYEEAIQFVPSSEMFLLYVKFLREVVSSNKGDVSHLLKVYEKAETFGCVTEDLACEYVSMYLQLGRSDEARSLAEKLCGGKFSESVKLWLLRVSLEMRYLTKSIAAPNKDDLQHLFLNISGVLTKVSVSEAESLWLMALKFFGMEKHYFDKLVELSLISVAKDGGGDKEFSLPSAVVNFVVQKDGIKQGRETYKRFLSLPRPGLDLYRNCIELEKNLACCSDIDCLANARKLYDSALATYDQNVSLWQDYHAMEVKLGTSESANAVYWRARKTLKNAAAFTA